MSSPEVPSVPAPADPGPGAAGSGRPERRKLDPHTLQGLAHPLRVRLFDELASFGPATASELARRFGESSGATSYHLRQLARHGFIEEVPDRGNGRDRWWGAVPGAVEVGSEELIRSSSPATREAVQLVMQEWTRSRHERLDHWLASTAQWPKEWLDASMDSTGHLRLTLAEVARLSAELEALVDRWVVATRGRDDDTLTDIEVQVSVFPLESRRSAQPGIPAKA